MEFLGPYHLQVEYWPSAKAVLPDFLSRLNNVVIDLGWLLCIAHAQYIAPELYRLF